MNIIRWFNMKLIDGWKHPFRFHSIKGITIGMILSAVATGLALAYSSQDASQHALYPRWVNDGVFFLIFAGSFIGRLWKQDKKNDTD